MYDMEKRVSRLVSLIRLVEALSPYLSIAPHAIQRGHIYMCKAAKNINRRQHSRWYRETIFVASCALKGDRAPILGPKATHASHNTDQGKRPPTKAHHALV
jgi:hypothetical protein